MKPLVNTFNRKKYERQQNFTYRSAWQRCHLDPILLILLLLLIGFGSAILYSATDQSSDMLVKQLLRLGLAFMILLGLAQLPPNEYRRFAPWLYLIGILGLLAVLVIGEIGKGAQRWLDLGLIRFQPSEILKLTLPMVLAWYFYDKPLPPTKLQLLNASFLIIIPVLLTAKQPDLGTAIIILFAGASVIFFAGISYWLIITLVIAAGSALPVLWHYMHDYQRQRVLTFLDPERDPLGSGYHIIQSKIAIGSGGLFGKGWFRGTQSNLQFLPEHATDFIFAVCGEEFGLVGCIALLTLFLLILLRCLTIAIQAQDTFSRLLASAITMIFFVSAYVNIGMVTGALPVVGLPLPLVSYGGTAMVTLMAGFGVLMSIHTHRKLLAR